MKFLICFSIAFFSSICHAELWKVTTGDGVFQGPTAIAACQAAFAVGGPANNTVSCNGAPVTCSVTVAPSSDPTSCRGVWNYSPVKVEETGCSAKKDQAEFGWITRTVGGPSPYGSFCTGGCEQYVTGPITNGDNPQGEYYTNGKTRTEYAKWQFSGNTCGAGTPEPPAKDTPSPTLPKKSPPCAPAEGVMTSSSGTIACVPEGTPGSAKPIDDKKKATDSFPDGSQKTTETITTRDPVTGVEDRRTTTTTTPSSSGSSGQAGTPGTQTSNSSGGQTPNGSTGSGKEGDSSSDFCAKNPNLQICKGGMNEEGTQKKILKNGEDTLEQIKSITDPGQTPYTAIKDAKQTEESDNKLKDENGKFKDAATGTIDPIAADKSAWQNALSSGWFEPVTRQGCGPVVWGFAGKTVTFDICPPAERLSNALEYAMWFYIGIGIFVALTGGRKGEA
jgi:hypothetical protein